MTSKSTQYEIGLIGLAVMGENLALNIAGKGFAIAVYNRTVDKVAHFVNSRGQGLPVGGAASMAEFTAMLTKPRKIILMVKAGQPVDDMLQALVPHLDPGDIIIDGGNSHFEDTRRRCRECKEQGFHFMGLGVSGGEEGALKGPSLMPGGEESIYKQVEPILLSIAAKVPEGVCCQYVGPDGAGHYVKIVHNGIEYGDMQLISEAYHLMRDALGLSADDLQQVFDGWNQGVLESFLIEITAGILARKDAETGKPVVDIIVDQAGQKGTGKWTIQSALDLGVPTPTITQAVFARYMSAYKKQRMEAANILTGPDRRYAGNKGEFIKAIHDALYASKICSYAQGFDLLAAAGKAYHWDLNYGDIALLWRGGCIIRARFLAKIEESFRHNCDLPNLMLAPFFRQALIAAQANWRFAVKTGKELGIPTPAFSASLDYYDSYRAALLPANLLQAQRDYFGAHTYERLDKPGVFHYDWY
ncbi:decarboxylating NADP(+)-dependent phosphogluconate dehydrogenase [Sporomusa sp.]|uniref:decarboxylating NADP(+)-dependent phosphogluconate dehydrogenase n=1 Tax=Sporomusa sp. TaxID=2078658 RepID=UPI002B8BC313|nr:decarboxylating NADP(+)-dependent phosphogluconate dehydrogenase [Sporomusa sp.]HWR07256.1 decarboxylating NADP(+)-dependent phosphogluconate dehydrogenase [Sporomusa sp.]